MHPLLARLPLVRRPYYQRDVARHERNLAIRERDLAIRERDAAIKERDEERETNRRESQDHEGPHDVMSKIFCIGAGKTGTTSLEAFFKQLGFTLGDQAAGESLIREWAVRNFEPIIALARSAQVFQDVPFCHPFTYAALDMAFPGSKFILSVRDDAEQWYGSLTRFHTAMIGKGRLPTADDLRECDYRYRGWILEAMKLTYGVTDEEPYEKQRMMSVYESHNAAVAQYFRHRPESLLTVNLAEPNAVEEILMFLKIPNAGQNMPHLNRTA